MRPMFPGDEAQQYEFVLTNAIETVDTAAEDHRKLLAEQEEQAKHEEAEQESVEEGPGVESGVAAMCARV